MPKKLWGTSCSRRNTERFNYWGSEYYITPEHVQATPV